MDECVAHAIERKDTDSAEYAASKIQSNLRRSSAVQKIALYYYDSTDLVTAKERLDSALKLIISSEDDVDKLSALLKIITVFAKIDEQRVSSLTELITKTVNNSPQLNSENKLKLAGKTEAEARKIYAANLLQVAYHIIPLCRLLAQKDVYEARSFAEGFQCKEIKAAAIFAVASGTYTASTSSAN